MTIPIPKSKNRFRMSFVGVDEDAPDLSALALATTRVHLPVGDYTRFASIGELSVVICDDIDGAVEECLKYLRDGYEIDITINVVDGSDKTIMKYEYVGVLEFEEHLGFDYARNEAVEIQLEFALR